MRANTEPTSAIASEQSDYRDRLYSRYVSSHLAEASLEGLSDLACREPYLRRLVRRHFPKSRDAKILDLGCGHGALIYVARQAGYQNCQGVDASAEQVELARRLGIDGVSQGNVRDVVRNSTPDTFDAIVAFDLIEHLTKNELLELVEGIHRALRPGGLLLLHTVNAASPFFGRIRYGDYTHEQAFTISSLRQVLRAYDFRDIRSFEDAPIVHGLKSAARWVLWQLVRGIFALIMAAETGSLRGHVFSQNFLVVATK